MVCGGRCGNVSADSRAGELVTLVVICSVVCRRYGYVI